MNKNLQIMKDLVEELNDYIYFYYDQLTSLLSDTDFNSKLEKLKNMEEKYQFIFSNSPTQNVGYLPAESG